MRSTLFGISIALVVLGSGAVQANNLVSNPGFETNNLVSVFTSWTNSGDGIFVDGTFPNSGNFDAAFTAPSNDPNAGTLSQAISTTSGQSYTLSFALLDEAGLPSDSFIVDFGGFTTTINGFNAGPPGTLPSGYTAETFSILGTDITGPSTTLSFQGLNDPSFGITWNLDDVDLEAAGVPEPSAILVFGAGLLGLASLARRRRRDGTS
jgi:hypothetical protein